MKIGFVCWRQGGGTSDYITPNKQPWFFGPHKNALSACKGPMNCIFIQITVLIIAKKNKGKVLSNGF